MIFHRFNFTLIFRCAEPWLRSAFLKLYYQIFGNKLTLLPKIYYLCNGFMTKLPQIRNKNTYNAL